MEEGVVELVWEGFKDFIADFVRAWGNSFGWIFEV
jgi:hypothetical protein